MNRGRGPSRLRPFYVGTAAGAVEPRCNGPDLPCVRGVTVPTFLVSNVSKEQAAGGGGEGMPYGIVGILVVVILVIVLLALLGFI